MGSSAVQRPPSVLYAFFVVSCACIVAISHRYHIAYMFESDRHFSHLSTLERHLTFRTEMGLYYSYYKTLIEAPSVADGFHSIMMDNRTEFPDTINTLQRFNLYPELVLSIGYRAFMNVMSAVGLPTSQCWKVRRGDDQSVVISCEGLGEPAYFYVEGAFLLNGLLAGIYFLFGVYLSGDFFGGVLTTVSLAYNHRECTRVQWTPALRESFAYPFYVLHIFAVTAVFMSRKSVHMKDSFVFIVITSVCFMLPWQFAQFALLTTLLSVFVTYALQLADVEKLRLYCRAQLISIVLAAILLFGNRMIIASYLFAALVTCHIIALLHPQLEKMFNGLRIPLFFCRLAILSICCVALKSSLSIVLNVSDDAHISDLIRSKLTSFANFHTMLYTCAAEFDFMQMETIINLTKTLLLPMNAIVLCFIFVPTIFSVCSYEQKQNRQQPFMRRSDHASEQENEFNQLDNSGENSPSTDRKGKKLKTQAYVTKYRQEKTVDNCVEYENLGQHTVTNNRRFGDAKEANETVAGTSNKPVEMFEARGVLVFLALQLCAFAVMAAAFMRLKLFWTPHMCLMTSLLASRQLFRHIVNRRNHYIVLSVVVALMSVEGIQNLQAEWAIMGDFDGADSEQLIRFIDKNIEKDAVFAGSMPTMATIKLCTSHPIVNHPHYEDEGLRWRTKRVYMLFSRKPACNVWRTLSDMQVEYAVLEQSWCIGQSRQGCSLADIWDLEDIENRGKGRLCEQLYRDPAPYFRRVFRNRIYDVLKVIEQPDASMDCGEP